MPVSPSFSLRRVAAALAVAPLTAARRQTVELAMPGVAKRLQLVLCLPRGLTLDRREFSDNGVPEPGLRGTGAVCQTWRAGCSVHYGDQRAFVRRFLAGGRLRR